MRSGAILSEVYSIRIRAVKALVAAADRRINNAADLREISSLLDRVTPRYADAKIAMVYAAFADLLRTLAMLVDWRSAVLDAAVEADRFLTSARERHRHWREEFSQRDGVAALAQTAGVIDTLNEVMEVGSLCKAVGATPLPIGIFTEDPRRRRIIPTEIEDGVEEKKTPPPQLAVAFVSFSVDSTPAAQTEWLTPRENHDLEIEVRVSRWPDGAEVLRLRPVTIEPSSTYELPEFQFTRPEGEPPFFLRKRGRAVLHVPQALRAQPFEFKYAADFEPLEVEQPVSIVGQRTLLIESVDLRRGPTSYAGINQRIIALRKELWQHPHVVIDDVQNAIVILAALGNLAGEAVQDNLFSKPIDEAAFQILARRDLRRWPGIGSRLDEHPRAAGGATDLSFEHIRIELKAQNTRPLRLEDCQQFVGQTTSYTVGSDKRIGVLCVLDGSAKIAAPFPAEDGMGILKTDDGAVAVVTVLIQGNLARPSDLSRKKSRGPGAAAGPPPEGRRREKRSTLRAVKARAGTGSVRKAHQSPLGA